MATLQIPVDRGYLNLLAHLREEKLRISFDALQAAICHYLIHLPTTQPTPAPLTTSIITSLLWRPLTFKGCFSLGNTFRVSVRQKFAELDKKERGLFDTSISSDLTSWLNGILEGLKDGAPLLRMSIAGGLRLGLDGIQDAKLSRSLLRKVEGIVVLAFAEAVEMSNSANDQWTSEFSHAEKDRAELSVLLASQYFCSFSTDVLSALNMFSLASSCLAMIEKGLASGNYLKAAREDMQRGIDGPITISVGILGFDQHDFAQLRWTKAGSKLERVIDALQASDCFARIAYLCRLLAKVISGLTDTSFRRHGRRELWELFNTVVRTLYSISRQVEEDWRSSPLADVTSETQLDETTGKVTEKIWAVLKTHLFSTLMLQQAMLDIILYHSPPSSLYSTSYLTSTILSTLSSLSFVISSFGGVAAGPTEAGTGPSFPELKKVFYMSVDILSTNVTESEDFVRSLVRDARTSSVSLINPFMHAKWSFILTCIEQFISVLDDDSVEEVVIPFCEPFLSDSSNRQTYEAAHSVMLSIFAAHAEKSIGSSSIQSKKDRKGKSTEKSSDISLARRLVPGYSQILLEDTRDGGLTTPQLRLAYAALVRSASTGRNPHHPPSTMHRTSRSSFSLRAWNGSEVDEEFSGDPALAWLCVEQLLRAHSAAINETPQIRTALSLALISLIPNVSLVLLPRLLVEVERVVDGELDSGRRRVLIENVFEEILERVGDAEREVAMRWWFQCSRKWGGPDGSQSHELSEQK
ncbi:hypothetical protein ACEPAI_9227 [Sanghuangporus weigelae]